MTVAGSPICTNDSAGYISSFVGNLDQPMVPKSILIKSTEGFLPFATESFLTICSSSVKKSSCYPIIQIRGELWVRRTFENKDVFLFLFTPLKYLCKKISCLAPMKLLIPAFPVVLLLYACLRNLRHSSVLTEVMMEQETNMDLQGVRIAHIP